MNTDSSNKHIEVAVTLPTNITFSYMVPDELLQLIETGKRVLVPFGNRRITGYITGNPPESKTGNFNIKPIIDILDDAPLFHQSHIPFFKWISGYYMYPFGEVIKSALPGGININDTRIATITEKGKSALSENQLTGPEKIILGQLEKGARKSGALLKNGETALPASIINSLAKRGAIVLTRELSKASAKQKYEKFLRAAGEDLPLEGLTEKRRKIIETLRDVKEISVNEFKKIHPTAAGYFKFLKDSGHGEFFEKKRYRDPFGESIEPDKPPELTPEQEKTVSEVALAMGRGFSSYLLVGVTGSGKTEVYMQLVSEAIKKGKTALVLVPEIALISQTERRFRSRFGEKIAVLHSALSSGEKYDQWMRIAEKKVEIVIGARSAIFAPLEKLGIIIVDEEHDASYKQENGLRYNARDLAIVRAKIEDCTSLLGSATPSVQSFYNASSGKFSQLRLTKRVSNRPMPEIDVVDLRKYKDLPGIRSFITPPLEESIRVTLEKKEQVLLFLNRRGYANYPVCATCGEPMKCVNCDISLTLHNKSNAYRCHMCSYTIASASKCRMCNSSNIKQLGLGTEKIEAAIKALFPNARVGRMDQDTTTRKGAVLKILKDVKDKKTDILVGTQMIAKGHDFPGITLVGIICADQSLNFPDFRACERTFQLLAQVAGRAGRGDSPGTVVMQTYNPDHFSILAAKKQDFFEFYKTEIIYRKSLGYPPFSRIVQVRISGMERNTVKQYAHLTGDFLNQAIMKNQPRYNSVGVLGPIEAAIPKMANRYRWQILLKSDNIKELHGLSALLADEINKSLKKNGIRISLDIDPYYMM